MDNTTIETLEIVIKARIEDALKNIKLITDEVKKQITNSTSSMNNLPKKTKEISSSVKTMASNVKSTMKQYENDVKKSTSKISKEMSKLQSKKIDIEVDTSFDTDSMSFEELEAKYEELKNIRDSILDSKEITLISDDEQAKLDDIIIKLAQIEQVKSLKTPMNIAEPAYSPGPYETPEFNLDEPVVKVDTNEAKNELNNFQAFVKQISIGIKNAFKGLGNLLVVSMKAGAQKVKSILSNLGGTISKFAGNFKKIKTSCDDAFSKGLKSIKRFSLSLLSIRTAFSAISKARQAYLSFDSQLQDSIQNSWNALGSLLAPILEYVASLFSKVTSAIATFVKALTGIDLVAKANAKALDKQAKSASNASKQLSSIDDISTLSSNSGGGGETAPTISTEEIDVSPFDKILERIKAIIEAWKNGNWGEVATLISKSFTDVFNFLNNKIKEIDFSSIGENISEFLTNIDFSGILTSFKALTNEIKLSFIDLFLSIDWPTTFANFSTGLRDAISMSTQFFMEVPWGEIGLMISNTFTSIDWGGIGSAILNSLWAKLSGILKLFLSINWKEVGTTISNAVKEWIETIITKFENTDWIQLGMDIANAIMDFLLNVDWLGLGANLLAGIASGIVSAIELVISCFAQLLGRILDFFGIHSPSTVFADMGINIIKGLVNGILSLKDVVINAFSTIWDGIKGVFSTVATFFKDTFSNAWTAVKNVFSTGGKIFDGIKDGIVKSFTSIVNAIIRGINKVVAIPFDGINGALKKIKSIDILGAKPFNWIPTIPVPKIPELKTGNVATEPTLAIFAEYANAKSNPEITSPQSIMKDTFKTALDEHDFNNNRQEHLTVQFGAETLLDDIIDYINTKMSRRGVSVWKEA